MEFNEHHKLRGLHAPFPASSPSWIRYDDEKAITIYKNKEAKEFGSRLHSWAEETINLKIKQPRSKKTLYAYVNDAIGYNMKTEQILYYSDLFFGTADAISFENGTLRIHDLKTGQTGNIESHIEQLMVYAALFCLEYTYDPFDIQMELRVYKQDDIFVSTPEPEDIKNIMLQIIKLDKLINEYKFMGDYR